MRKGAPDVSAENGATSIGTAHQAPPDGAAVATGCCIRYFDYNDTYLSKEPGHPSDNIAAAFAVAESVGTNGRELITAIALAYEVQCRLCDAASIRARGWDHVTYGAFSTALAAAKLMKLDAEKKRHAVSIAGVAGHALRLVGSQPSSSSMVPRPTALEMTTPVRWLLNVLTVALGSGPWRFPLVRNVSRLTHGPLACRYIKSLPGMVLAFALPGPTASVRLSPTS